MHKMQLPIWQLSVLQLLLGKRTHYGMGAHQGRREEAGIGWLPLVPHSLLSSYFVKTVKLGLQFGF